ncbi:dihydrorhizobitoxine desaturase [Ktedonobacter sp. SOSP1-52]|uniref:fatty acid desaturase family protein n=1 Tax=Ktedonobacter sp. SOSP1-52 TaxID=2778366 RepID=UPI0019167BAB|nr:fatty acid desaturase [Ktedonobacter sp. SOSP1-52]GHO64991.1 dihydrorhizobitoxine desaturase [Ktedonobacter sp. SOSP1-52]
MHDLETPQIAIPRLEELGADLLVTTRRQRLLTLARPFIGLFCYAVAAYFNLWWLYPFLVFLIFVAVVTVTHDVVHRSLGLSQHQTEYTLFFMGMVLMESGHAYRTTHVQHHKYFPSEEDQDPEGYPAHLSLLGALFYGPVFLYRLWWWAFLRNQQRFGQRMWLILEALVPFVVVIVGLLLWNTLPAVLLYAFFALVGSWVYPLLTVYLPHKDYGETPLTQTHTLRGRIIPLLFLELTYHLEHHLYPQVPSHNLAELARRLDPFFKEAGVQYWYVI